MYHLYWSSILFWRNLYFSLLRRPNYFEGEAAKKSCENIRKIFSKARKNIKKSKLSGNSSQEAREAAGNIESYDFWI